MNGHVRPNRRRADALDKQYRAKLDPIIGQANAGNLTRADVMRVIDHLQANETKAVAANTAREFRAFVNWCGDRDLIPAGIAARIKVKPVAARERDLSPDELRAVLLAAKKMGRRPETVVTLLAMTGCRLNEICALRHDEVDLPNARLNLRPSSTKTKKARHVFLSPQAVAVLERWFELRRAEESPFVFPGDRKGPSFPYDGSNLARQLRERGQVNSHVHDIRKTVASFVLSQGYSTEVVRLILGHATSQVFTGALSHYVTADALETQQRAAVETLGQFVADLTCADG